MIRGIYDSFLSANFVYGTSILFVNCLVRIKRPRRQRIPSLVEAAEKHREKRKSLLLNIELATLACVFQTNDFSIVLCLVPEKTEDWLLGEELDTFCERECPRQSARNASHLIEEPPICGGHRTCLYDGHCACDSNWAIEVLLCNGRLGGTLCLNPCPVIMAGATRTVLSAFVI